MQARFAGLATDPAYAKYYTGYSNGYVESTVHSTHLIFRTGCATYTKILVDFVTCTGTTSLWCRSGYMDFMFRSKWNASRCDLLDQHVYSDTITMYLDLNHRVYECVAPYEEYVWLGYSSRDMSV